MQENLMIQGLIECLQSRFKQDDIERLDARNSYDSKVN